MYGYGLILYLLGLLVAIRRKPDDRKNIHKETSKDCKPFPVPLPVINIPPTPSDQERAKQEKKDCRERWKFRIEVFGSIVLTVYAGFTIAIWWANKRISDEAHKQTEFLQGQLVIAQKQFQIAYAPSMDAGYISVHNFQPEQPIMFKIDFWNSGRGPAATVDITANIGIRDTTPFDYTHSHLNQTGADIWPREQGKGVPALQGDLMAGGVADATQYQRYLRKQAKLFIWGTIEYTDRLSTKSCKNYCRFTTADKIKFASDTTIGRVEGGESCEWTPPAKC